MDAFLKLVRPQKGARIVDLGGTPDLWNLVDHSFDVTLVNLWPDENWKERQGEEDAARPPLQFVRGDATDLTSVFGDMSFDVVFSNSLIEHVGDESRQAMFSREVRRLAPAHWVQTPSDRSPIEPHTNVPLYWSLPQSIRKRLLSRWHRLVPEWADEIEETRVLSRKRVQELFPGSKIYVERALYFEKSYAAYLPVGADRSRPETRF